jgi:hypothetical protein
MYRYYGTGIIGKLVIVNCTYVVNQLDTGT